MSLDRKVEMSTVQLREHQIDAASRIRKWVGLSAKAAVPAQGFRGTVVSATGSGKTYTAAWAALERFRGERILVMVPTLDLLVQTPQAGGRMRHTSPMVPVGPPET